MDWREMYKSRLTTAGEAVNVVKSGDFVIPGHAASESELLVNALAGRYAELENVTLIQGVALGSSPYCKPEMAGHFILKSMFVGANTRQSIWENRGTFFPLMFHEFPRAFREGYLGSDVFLTMVSPPDEHGYCSLGMSVDHSKELVKCAKTVIAEVNPNVPRTYGDTFVHVSDLDYIVENDGPILELTRFAAMDEVTQAIGRNVAGLIKDGDTLQMGAGTIPDAILHYLKDKNDLGIHTEMFSDGLIDLIEAGIVNGFKKTLNPGKIVVTFAEGTRKVYEYINRNPRFQFHPVDYVNNPCVIAQNDNMVAINSALEIDLSGQVCAEALGTRQYSGIGGQLDFIRGAAAAKNGRPIIVLQSTAKKGTISRISCQLKAGTPVTTTRNDVHWVVTEYGAVNLFCKSEKERAAALISIAHPEFRTELKRQYRELYGRVL
ncbi:acetyl-CoA hydrolase/transferase C-terminal domain-containing protein [Desulfosporosinus sp. PR]|uniref:acetyl-CoA hydrolase/transferase family protein n=1 Tax=Candidatus Desulfosporosinus nitrosoreducens TaxID=3401928 RepID=UPI0027FF37EE|nr:acetyl-CoA hydrolase/transferase C-terminal domain-containing protein [Desulfosporosinus sp. PR]MDQ7094602.1 acetyl-CoA hydrolase/transferase C-terminal domain-containing protein [Desulfosporosinus sp. PR]